MMPDAPRDAGGERTLQLTPIEAREVEPLARQIAAIDPWLTLGITADRLASTLGAPDPHATTRAIRLGSGLPIGAVGLRDPWLYGPYLSLLAVLPGRQRRGVGAAVLALVEAEARALPSARNLWVCASGFNVGALAFYQRHGFERVGTLEGLLRDGLDEILLRKRLASANPPLSPPSRT